MIKWGGDGLSSRSAARPNRFPRALQAVSADRRRERARARSEREGEWEKGKDTSLPLEVVSRNAPLNRS
jgi:hypothetical protein